MANGMIILSLESVHLTKELKALQATTTGNTKKKDRIPPRANPIQVIFTKDNHTTSKMNLRSQITTVGRKAYGNDFFFCDLCRQELSNAYRKV
jgi:hypothetical protein